jgi:homoserine dehydrogenase
MAGAVLLEGGRVSAVGESCLSEAAPAIARPPLAPPRGIRPARDLRLVRVALLGYGQVGQAVAALLQQTAVRDRLRSAGLAVECVSALVRDPYKARTGPPVPLATLPALPSSVDVIVEILGGVEPARSLVACALRAGLPVVTANKTLVAAHGAELRALARRYRTGFACEAAVIAGVPFLGALSRRPLVSAARRFVGIVNGTSHFISCAIDRGQTFAGALAEAAARGYAEADSSADTSGRDAAEKLTILLRLAGHDVQTSEIPRAPLDLLTPELLTGAKRLGGIIKPLAIAELSGSRRGTWIGPAFVPVGHPFARLQGVANALQVTNLNGETITFSGPGAGPETTALTIIDDLAELATSRSYADGSIEWRRRNCHSAGELRTPPDGTWLTHIAMPRRTDPRGIASRLAAAGVPPMQICAHAGAAIARTVPVSWPAIQTAAAALRESGAEVTVLPAIDEA